jgi:hypothetical protein
MKTQSERNELVGFIHRHDFAPTISQRGIAKAFDNRGRELEENYNPNVILEALRQLPPIIDLRRDPHCGASGHARRGRLKPRRNRKHWRSVNLPTRKQPYSEQKKKRDEQPRKRNGQKRTPKLHGSRRKRLNGKLADAEAARVAAEGREQACHSAAAKAQSGFGARFRSRFRPKRPDANNP